MRLHRPAGAARARNTAIRAALAAAFPRTPFVVEGVTPSHRNHYTEASVLWTGGPNADEVRAVVEAAAVAASPFVARIQYGRTQSDAERAADLARIQAESEEYFRNYEVNQAREAAERDARAATRKEAAKAKAAATRAEKALLAAELKAAFPAAVFRIFKSDRGWWHAESTGGPAEAVVQARFLHRFQYRRVPTRAEIDASLAQRKAERDAAERKARRERNRPKRRARQARLFSLIRHTLPKRPKPLNPQLMLPMALPIHLLPVEKTRVFGRFRLH